MIIRDELGNPALNTVHVADAMKLLGNMPAHSVDCILTDVPYGVTACAWDKRPDLDQMWRAFKRVIKPRGAIVMTASQPFTSILVCSNLEMFRYEWVWEKTNAVDFTMAEVRPRKSHENILVFSQQPTLYFPQMEIGTPYVDKPRKRGNHIFGSTMPKLGIVNVGTRYPSSVQKFSNGNNFNSHPTQKPVALFEYLIRTYTQVGDLVLDPYCGSGTTAIAARNTGRRWICGDLSPDYCAIARQRLDAPFTPNMFEQVAPPPMPVAVPLFAGL